MSSTTRTIGDLKNCARRRWESQVRRVDAAGPDFHVDLPSLGVLAQGGQIRVGEAMEREVVGELHHADPQRLGPLEQALRLSSAWAAGDNPARRFPRRTCRS